MEVSQTLNLGEGRQRKEERGFIFRKVKISGFQSLFFIGGLCQSETKENKPRAEE
jgi:hypothetical protein